MIIQRKWNFGLGTIFSLIVVYFIFLYSRDKGWAILAFLSKWYLIIVGGLLALSLGIIFIILIISLLMLLIAMLKIRTTKHEHKRQKNSPYIDAEYKIKE